jgi:hypothetical protein
VGSGGAGDAATEGVPAESVAGTGGKDFASAMAEDAAVVSLEVGSGGVGGAGALIEAESSGWPVICAAAGLTAKHVIVREIHGIQHRLAGRVI